MENNNILYHKLKNGQHRKYEQTQANTWTPTNTLTTVVAGAQRRCIVARKHPRAIPQNMGQPYNGNVPHTCSMPKCLDKYLAMRPTSESDGDKATITKWEHDGPRLINFRLQWDMPDESGNTVYTTIGKTELDTMTNDSHCTLTNLTKCNNCPAAYCDQHSSTDVTDAGWRQARTSSRAGQYGTWTCEKCQEKHTKRSQQEDEVTLVHVAEPVTCKDVAPSTNTQPPHTWLKEQKDKRKWISHALSNENPLCRVYSDGSAKHTD